MKIKPSLQKDQRNIFHFVACGHNNRISCAHGTKQNKWSMRKQNCQQLSGISWTREVETSRGWSNSGRQKVRPTNHSLWWTARSSFISQLRETVVHETNIQLRVCSFQVFRTRPLEPMYFNNFIWKIVFDYIKYNW